MTEYEIHIYDESNNLIRKHLFSGSNPPKIREGVLFVDSGDVSYGYKYWGWYKNYEVKNND